MTDTEGIKTVLHPVTDLDRAKAMYTALLGIPPQADSPITSDTRSQDSRSAWCRAVDRRA